MSPVHLGPLSLSPEHNMFLYMIYTLCIAIIVTSLCYRFSYAGKLIRKIPGYKGVPFFGNAFDILRSPESLFRFARTLGKHGKLTKLHSFHYRAINIYDHSDLEKILSTTKYSEKTLPYVFLEPWLGKGLLTSNGEKWFQRRKMLTPAFHFNILKGFFKIFTEQAEEFVNILQEETDNEKTAIIPLIMKHTLRIVCETSMGSSMNEDIRYVSNKYMNAILLVGECFLYRLTRVWFYLDLTFNMTRVAHIQQTAVTDLHKFTKQIIKERRKFREKNVISSAADDDGVGKKVRLAMLDLLLDQEKKGMIDEDGIREEVDTFMFEGHDTTAMALCYMTMRIANETEVQEKIYEELCRIFGDSNRTPTTDDIAEMKYLECCIKESLRLYPSVPFIARVLKEDVELSGYTVPAGTIANIHIFDIHRNEEVFPEPEKFIPERFLPENVATRHPYAYIPFSAGSRNCIGQKFAMLEMKTVMCELLRNFRLEAITRPEDLVFHCDIVLRTKTPVHVKFHRRTKQKIL